MPPRYRVNEFGELVEITEEETSSQEQKPSAPPLSFQDRMDYMDAGITREVSPEENADAAARMKSGVSGAVQGGIQGGIPGALIGGGAGVAFPNQAHGTKIGQASGARLAIEALMGKYKTAGRIVQGVASGVGDQVGGILGDFTDKILGNERETALGRGISSVGAGLGQAANPFKAGKIGPEQRPRIPFPEPGKGAYLNYAQDDTTFGKVLQSLMRGSDEYVDDSMKGFKDAWVHTNGTPMSDTETVDFLRGLHKTVTKVGAAKGSNPGVIDDIAKIAGDDKATMQTVFTILFPKNGGDFADPAAVGATLETLKNNLKGSPEVYEKFVGTWLTRNVLEETLTVGKGDMAERGANFFADTLSDKPVRNAASGRMSSELVIGEDPLAKTLNGTELLERLSTLKGVLQKGLGKSQYASLVNMAKSMQILDPENTGGIRQKLVGLVMPSMRYNANRMIFYGSQAALLGGAGFGLSQLAGQSIGAGLMLGGAAAVGGLTLDKMAMVAMKNPELMQAYVDALEEGNTGLAQTVIRSMVSSSQQPLLDAETKVQAMPTTR